MMTSFTRIHLRRGVALLLTLASVALAAGSQPPRGPLRSARDRMPAPDFALTDASGAPIVLSSYKGRVVLLDFWATWCTGCKVEIPWYMDFQKKYKQRGLASIGVAMDEDGWKTVTPYLKKKPITYPIVVGDANFAIAYNVTSLPMTLL